MQNSPNLGNQVIKTDRAFKSETPEQSQQSCSQLEGTASNLDQSPTSSRLQKGKRNLRFGEEKTVALTTSKSTESKSRNNKKTKVDSNPKVFKSCELPKKSNLNQPSTSKEPNLDVNKSKALNSRISSRLKSLDSQTGLKQQNKINLDKKIVKKQSNGSKSDSNKTGVSSFSPASTSTNRGSVSSLTRSKASSK